MEEEKVEDVALARHDITNAVLYRSLCRACRIPNSGWWSWADKPGDAKQAWL